MLHNYVKYLHNFQKKRKKSEKKDPKYFVKVYNSHNFISCCPIGASEIFNLLSRVRVLGSERDRCADYVMLCSVYQERKHLNIFKIIKDI